MLDAHAACWAEAEVSAKCENTGRWFTYAAGHLIYFKRERKKKKEKKKRERREKGREREEKRERRERREEREERGGERATLPPPKPRCSQGSTFLRHALFFAQGLLP